MIAKNILIILGISLLLDASSLPAAQASTVCGQYDTILIMGGEYIVQNNIWRATTAQCVSVPDTNVASFNVSKSEHDQSQVASYPSIYKGCHWGNCTTNSGMPVLINQIASAPFTWSVTPASSGIWNNAAEAWFSPQTDSSGGYGGGAELMIWLNSNGMPPAGSQVDTVNIGGAMWEVWFANIGWNYIAYRRNGVNSVSLDLNDFITDAESRGYLQTSWYLHSLEAGTEIASGGAGFVTNSFSFSLNKKACPATAAVESEADAAATLTTLRDYRDTVLDRAPRGQRYTQLFYKYSPEAVWLMATDRSLRTKSRAALRQLLPAIRGVLAGQDYQVRWGDRIAIHGLINAFAAKGSAEFRRDLRAVQRELWWPQVWQELLGGADSNQR